MLYDLKEGQSIRIKKGVPRTISCGLGSNDSMQPLEGTIQEVSHVSGTRIKLKGYTWTWHCSDCVPFVLKTEDMVMNIPEDKAKFKFNPEELSCELMKS